MPERSGITRKILSLLLTLCLLASLVPAVSAEGRETPFAATIAAGTVFYAEPDLKTETGTLAKDAVVLVTEEKGKADHITYKLDGKKAQSWIPKEAAILIAATPTDLLPLIPDENLTLTPPAPVIPTEGNGDTPGVIPSEVEESPTDSPSDPSANEDGVTPPVVPTEGDEETPPVVPTEGNDETPGVIPSEVEESPSDSPSDPSANEDGETPPSVIPTEVEESLTNPTDNPDVVPTEGDPKTPAVILSEDEESPSEPSSDPAPAEGNNATSPVLPTTVEEAPATPTDLQPETHATGSLHIDDEDWTRLVDEELSEPEEKTEEPLSQATFSMVDGELVTSSYIPSVTTALPEVREQDPFGTCWAFAAIGGMEIDLIARGLANSTIDLSEFFLAYYLAHNYAYPKGGMGEDDIWTEMYDSYYSYLDIGGTSTLAYRILAGLIGTTTEADNKYPQNRSEQNKEPGSFTIAAQMTGAYVVSATKRTEIQQLIKEHGAVDASIWMPTSGVPSGYYSGFSQYNTDKICLYGNYPHTNHDILLVGWDDNFPVSNFTGSKKPTKPGAWLVRNSWGYNGYGVNGYFWISYEDASLTSGAVTAFDAENRADQIDHNAYSYDHSPYPNWGVMITEPTATVVQKFTIQAYETVTAVGVETEVNKPDDKLDISVKVTAGGKTVTGSKPNVGEGFYRISVGSGLSFTTDTVVTVEVTYKALTSGMTIRVPYEGEVGATLGGDVGAYHLYGDQDGGGWTVNGIPQEGDPRIKVYTRDNAGAVKVTGISLNKTSITNARVTEPIQLTATVSPSNASNKHVSWTSSNTEVATVDQNGKVTLWATGESVITATTASGGKKATCKITVPVAKPTGLKIQGIGASTYTINNANAGNFWFGSTLKINIAFTPSYATDRDVTWTTSNSNVLALDDVYMDGSASFICKGNGSTTLKVASKNYPNLYDVVQIIIDLHRLVTSVSLDRTSASIPVDGNFRLYATVAPSDADNKSVIWTSSNANIASVDSEGNVYGRHYGTATITVTTVDGAKTASCEVTVTPQDPVEAFIFRMYRTCLLRDPDETGMAYWVGRLRSGDETGASAVFGFYHSNEMKARNLPNDQYLIRAYEGIMGRGPDAGGYAYWLGQMEAGVSRAYLISGFLTSNEFDALCRNYGINKGSYSSSEPRDQNVGVTGFVSRLYTKLLGRMFDENGLNYWCSVVLQNPVRATLLKVALEGFLHSNEFLNAHLNDTQYLTVLYRAFLGREADTGGMQYWLGQIQSGVSRDKVAEGFANSNEFMNIMASYGFNK